MTVGLICAFALAGVFVWAAAAKLRRQRKAAAGFRAMGLPAARALARAVPGVELVVAVALVAAPRVGGAAALVLLALFTLVLVRALRAGVASGCACFGTAGGRRLSRRDLVRNAALAALAVAAVFA